MRKGNLAEQPEVRPQEEVEQQLPPVEQEELRYHQQQNEAEEARERIYRLANSFNVKRLLL